MKKKLVTQKDHDEYLKIWFEKAFAELLERHPELKGEVINLNELPEVSQELHEKTMKLLRGKGLI